MSFEIKIRGATPRSGEPLCYTCSHGHVQRGFNQSEELIHCSYGSPIRPVLFRVRECSDYENRCATPFYELREIATDLNARPVPSARPAGFFRREEVPTNGGHNDDE